MRHRTIMATLFVLTCAASAAIAAPPAFLNRPATPHVRILCYNVNWDAIFPVNDPQNHRFRRFDRSESFVRIVKAVAPDIACVQEINSDRDPQQVADILDRTVPLSHGEKWRSYRGRDNVILSRYDLHLTNADTLPPSGRGHAMALVDLPAALGSDLYLVNAHFKSAGGPENIARRQRHADAIIQWIRDIKSAGGHVDLPAGTPYVILGDLNVYDSDPHHHLTTLLTGDIVDEVRYGKDIRPDWDNTDLTDALPRHNGAGPDTYTWRDDTSQFAPYPLDRVVFTDSVLAVANAFVLNTAAMSDGQLKAAGLKRDDVALDAEQGIFDHFPIVVDFAIRLPAKEAPPAAETLPTKTTPPGSG